MQQIVSFSFLVIGSLFIFIAALGVLRFPDLFMRISSSTKASTLGVGFSLLSLAVHFNDFGVTMRALATAAFLAISAPVAAHLISCSAYSTGVRLWEGTITDELSGMYDKEKDTLGSPSFDHEEAEP